MPPPLDPFYPYRLAHWAVTCWLNLTFVLMLSAATSAAIAAVTFYVHRKGLRDEKWLFFFGAAFATLALQYGLRAGLGPGRGDLFFAVCSSINNILFFFAAWLLRDWEARLPSRWRLVAIVGLLLLPIVPVARHWLGIHERWPDDVASFICFSYIGVAIATNIDYHRRGLRGLAVLVAFVYGLLHLVYTAVRLDATATAFAPMWSAIAATPLPAGLWLKGRPSDAVDALILSVLIPMKVALFGVALVLMARATLVLSPDESRSLFENVAKKRLRTVEPLGLGKVIYDTCAADDVELCYRVPGDERRRVVRLHWPERPLGVGWQEPVTLPSPDESVVAAAYATQRQRWSLKHKGVDSRPDSPGSHAACPIWFHGAIVGVLKVEWRRQRAFPPSMLRRLERVADLVAPSVQAHRQLAALDACSARFAAAEGTTTRPTELIATLARAVHETHTPLATGLLVDVGFVRHLVVVGDGPAGLHAGEAATEERMGELLRRAATPEGEIQRELQPVASHNLRLGTLSMGIHARGDAPDHPTIADDPLHRRLLADLLSAALVDGYRRHFAALLHELQIQLSSDRGESLDSAAAAVAEAAREGGLLWAVLEHQGQGRFVGDAMGADPPARLAEGRVETDPRSGLLFRDFAGAGGPTPSVGLPVPGTEMRLWFGLGRRDIEDTLRPGTPWHAFLHNVADSLSPVIQRIHAAQQVQALQTAAAQFHGLATAAVTTGTLLHQIANLTNELGYGVKTVHDGLRVSRAQWTAQQRPLLERQMEILTEVERATDVLRNLLEPLLSITKLDARRPCRLVDAVEETRKLLAGSLRLHDIALTDDVSGDLSIDMPFHVATFAIANLVSNAKDAIQHNGKVHITARRQGPSVVCDVSNDGPGIPAEIRSRLFGLGGTTKAGSGGWGLYLARRSLSENRGAIDLVRAEPGDVCFSIRFPAHRARA